MKKLSLKRTFALATSAIALTTAFVGCSDYTGVFTNDQLDNLYNQKTYDEAFVKTFGKIDPNHDWGMNEEIGAIPGPLMTRADGTTTNPTEPHVELNRNQWTEFTDKSEVTFPDYGTGAPKVKVPNYTDKYGAFGYDYIIPGFPHLNGLYYVSKGNVEDNYYTGDEITSGMVPCGDVTPYEIQYVSNWFRTHRNPKSNVTLHLSDFFIQNISWDNDQVEYSETSTRLPIYSSWPMTGNNGSNITSRQQAIANNTAEKGGYTGKTGENIHTNNYVENLTEDINYSLDHLCFKDMDGRWFHVNDFNGGNSNFSPEDRTSNPNREIKFIRSSGTEDFRCRPSWGTGHQGDDCGDDSYINSWVLVRLTWNETVKHSKSPYYPLGITTIPREGYYLAFDFHAKKNNGTEVVNRDGYYSNWIVKITPAHFNPNGHSRRIFCEDIGGGLDFDFNDAVIDVAFDQVNGKYQPIISVQAAGGTMPIYVEQDDDKYELHKLLGAEVNTPANVVMGAKPYAPAIYRSSKTYTKTNAGQVSITVHNNRNGETYEINGQSADNNDDERTESMPENNMDKYYNTKDFAPRAFSAPISVKWSKEWNNISKPYQDFTKWVNNKNWSAATTKAKWYENITDAPNNLYTSTFVPEEDHPTGGGSDAGVVWTEITPDAGAASTVQKVGADSYMKINGYTGPDAILAKLNNLSDDQRATFVVVLSSATLYNQIKNGVEGPKLEGCLIPADISGSTMSYKTNTFTVSNIKTFNPSVHVVTNDGEFGDNTYTYTLQFSFTKAQIERATNAYHDYLLLFLKAGNYVVGSGNNDVKVEKWYVHY